MELKLLSDRLVMTPLESTDFDLAVSLWTDPEVVASIDANNVASRNVLEKSGFLYRGRTLCWGKDSPIYKLTRDEWIEMRQSP